MRSLLITATAAFVLAMGSGAHAAQSITFTSPAADGSFSGMFGDTGVSNAPGTNSFTDTFTFTLPAGVTSSTISSTFTSDPSNNIDFTSVTLDGTPFTVGSTGQNEFQFLNGLSVNGLQTLVVAGTSGGNGSYSGAIDFSLAGGAGAVPEPASWALMILGFGGAGALIRKRRRLALA